MTKKLRIDGVKCHVGVSWDQIEVYLLRNAYYYQIWLQEPLTKV